MFTQLAVCVASASGLAALLCGPVRGEDPEATASSGSSGSLGGAGPLPMEADSQKGVSAERALCDRPWPGASCTFFMTSCLTHGLSDFSGYSH